MCEEQSPKGRAFLLALERLCRQHNVQLAVNGYDWLEVWDLRPGEDPLYAAGIRDRTKRIKSCKAST